MNYCYITWDMSQMFCDNHFFLCRSLYCELQEGQFPSISELNHPPLVYLVSILFSKFIGFSMFTARLSISVFIVIFLLSMYGIGKELGGELGGICTCALAMGSPTIGWAQCQYLLDFPQVAMSALAFYYLLTCRGFSDRKNSLLFGFFLGLALLTKWSALFFLFFPFLWFILPHFYRGKRSLLVTLLALIYLVIVWLCILRHIIQLDTTADWYSFPIRELFAGRKMASVADGWEKNYLLGVFIPSLLFFMSTFYLEKKWRRNETDDVSHYVNMLNFARALSICVAMFGFWLIFNASGVAEKLNVDYFENLGPVREGLVTSYSNLFYHYSFAMPLMLIGIVFAFALPDDRFRRISLFSGLIFVFIFFYFNLKYYCDELRYVLGMVIFSIPLGGFWIGRTGFLRKPLTVAVVALSVVSLVGWTITGVNGKYFHEVFNGDVMSFDIRSPQDRQVFYKILRRNPPQWEVYDLTPALKRIEDQKFVLFLMGWEYSEYDMIFREESLLDESLRLNRHNCYFVIYKSNYLGTIVEILKNEKEWPTDVIIIMRKNEYPYEFLSGLKMIYAGYDMKIDSWDRPGDTRMYYLKFEKNDG